MDRAGIRSARRAPATHTEAERSLRWIGREFVAPAVPEQRPLSDQQPSSFLYT